MYRQIKLHLVLLGFLVLDGVLGCPVYRCFGVTCPGCGLTRAWLCFLRGDWPGAIRWHLLFLPAPLFILLFAHRDMFPKSRLLDSSLFVFALLLAAYQLWRM
ncbi:MAG: DUF2752 domain-containing protein [Lawsonibacter sp.]|jgi:hypothetical protein|nr:DUF2752 domain-containing protein [Lawsonibacter sp.]